VPDDADLDAAFGEFTTGRLDVGDGLDHAKIAGRVVVNVEGETGLLCIERGGLVDVGHRNRDDLDLVVHQAPASPR
jgi:hypothetical protein